MLAFSNDYYGLIFRATQSVELFCAYIIYSADAEKHTKHIGKTARKGYNVKDDTPDKI